jgi:hypothetical protein
MSSAKALALQTLHSLKRLKSFFPSEKKCEKCGPPSLGGSDSGLTLIILRAGSDARAFLEIL